jgi:hypothetical protein
MRIDAWIQSADYSIREFPKLSLSDAIEMFKTYDWQKEYDLEYQFGMKNSDFCSAGFGLSHPAGHELWIRPRLADDCWLTCRIKTQRTFLGLFRLPDREYESHRVPFSAIPDYISEFFVSDPSNSTKWLSLN